MLLLSAGIVGLHVLGRRLNPSRFIRVVVALFLAIGLVRASGHIEIEPAGVAYATADPTALYVFMLDGYPRLDSLAEAGVDNTRFITALEERGFDHYPDAVTPTTWSELTLTTMLTAVEVEDTPTTDAQKRVLRKDWVLPEGFLAIDPPIGHVTIPGGAHVRTVGVTDFEAHLLGMSLLGNATPRPVREWLAGSVLAQHRFAIEAAARTDATRVFTHVLAPHPPFVFSADEGSGCWPSCHLWKTTARNLSMTSQAWTDAMARQIRALNAAILVAVDEIVARRPEAIIVLMSDHGMRRSDGDPEWHRSFLAARTPGLPRHFGLAPTPADAFRQAVTLALESE
jgi:hypothetical protein